MKAHLEHDFMRNGFRAVFLSDNKLEILVQKVVGDRIEWRYETRTETATAEEVQVFIPAEALEALVEAASDHLPPSAATDRHLYDAIGVRDRLLALVEKRK